MSQKNSKKNLRSLQKPPKPTMEELVRHKIIIFLEGMDQSTNEANLYLEQLHDWLIKNVNEDDEVWGFYNMFLHNYVQLTNTYKNLGEYLTQTDDDKPTIENKNKKEVN